MSLFAQAVLLHSTAPHANTGEGLSVCMGTPLIPQPKENRMFTLDNTTVDVRDLDFFVDFEMTPLLDMTLEITDLEIATPTTPVTHYYAAAEDTDNCSLMSWIFHFNTWSHNTQSGRINGCSLRNAGRKSRSTK